MGTDGPPRWLTLAHPTRPDPMGPTAALATLGSSDAARPDGDRWTAALANPGSFHKTVADAAGPRFKTHNPSGEPWFSGAIAG
jgi:hypothetical protein